ncbi:hypothetical protein ACCS45_03980 [Rhizobium ruizarguesonis]
MSKPTIHWRTVWYSGDPSYICEFSSATDKQISNFERIAETEGYVREGEMWRPTTRSRLHRLFDSVRAIGFDFEFERNSPDAPLDLQRLKLTTETRRKVEAMENFELTELAGYCPVQAQGEVDGQYFYFRARGSYWRFEFGGNETGTQGPKWWHEEYWPGESGFDAGYLSDEDAVACVLKSVDLYRTTDRGRFNKGHPDYERTILEGWSMGALTLARAVRRLGVEGHEAIKRATEFSIELPSGADLELKSLSNRPSAMLVLDKATGRWIKVNDDD